MLNLLTTLVHKLLTTSPATDNFTQQPSVVIIKTFRHHGKVSSKLVIIAVPVVWWSSLSLCVATGRRGFGNHLEQLHRDAPGKVDSGVVCWIACWLVLNL